MSSNVFRSVETDTFSPVQIRKPIRLCLGLLLWGGAAHWEPLSHSGRGAGGGWDSVTGPLSSTVELKGRGSFVDMTNKQLHNFSPFPGDVPHVINVPIPTSQTERQKLACVFAWYFKEHVYSPVAGA
jgi:hypothetical protein